MLSITLDVTVSDKCGAGKPCSDCSENDCMSSMNCEFVDDLCQEKKLSGKNSSLLNLDKRY